MSGKAARRLRKKLNFSKTITKKAIAFTAGLCFLSSPVMADNEVLISVFPHFTKPFGETHQIEYGIGGGLKVTYRPTDFLNIFAQGDYLSMALPGIAPISIINGTLGAGYHLDLSERVGLDFNVNVGAYNAKTSRSISGISAGAQLGVSYKINPIISADLTASATHFASGAVPLMGVNAAVSPGVTFNVTQMFNSSAKVDIQKKELAPVFPVLYSWYENNSFGEIEIINNEDNAISDVTVSFYQPQYMAHPKECGTIKTIAKGQSATCQLLSFFNEQILELTEKTDTNSYVIVNYSNMGLKRTQTYALEVPVYGRNNMSWDDDRRAAAFVSSKDPAAMQFAKYVTSIVRENFREDVPINIQYATGIFEALNQFGINYVIDPSSAFEDNVGTSSIDFLQFPYQTLMYKGGDCDDLSILFCSLFEAVGIRTAFITIPGHIYMAFDSGMTKEQAEETLETLNNVIVLDDEVWVPLEITLTDEGFYKAHRTGAREWRVANAQGKAALYKMEDSWKIYQPISAPGANANINLPESDTVYVVFENSIKEWSKGELKSSFATERPVYVERISPVQETLTLMDTSSPYEKDAVLREDPFSDDSLLDILALASDVVALGPIPEIKEEDLEVFEDEEEKKDSDPNPVVPEPKVADPELKVVEREPNVVEREPNVVAPEPTVGVPEPVEGQEENQVSSRSERLSEPVEVQKHSPLVKVFIGIGALLAAAAGLFIFGKKKRVNK
ncbi:MAG: hypothetical protein IKX70_06625 [Treponema sp.]|nr:hypothetical protein [Treponema sp.]